MSLDVRAWIYCNLGTVISGNLQESSIIGAGLINVTGTLVLSGVYKIREGDPVELSYYKNNRIARLGRKLRVISVFANPATRQTEVSIGCYLTYQAQSAPPPQVLNSTNDTSTPDLTGLAALLLIKPISAKFVAETCCAELGLQHDPFPLTNEFYREKFEISGPYLNVVSDLLISENYVGYVDSTETLRFINLNDVGGRGPVLNETNIIDVSPINSGDPDADVVYSIVQYTEIKLDASIDADSEAEVEDIEDVLERNGIPATPANIAVATGDDPTRTEVFPYSMEGYSVEPAQVAVFRYQPPIPDDPDVTPPPALTQTITYNPSTRWRADYEGLFNRVMFREEITGGVWGDTYTTDSYEYSLANRAETVIKTTTVEVPGAEIVMACGFPPEVIPPLPGNIITVGGTDRRLKEKIVTTTRTMGLVGSKEQPAESVMTTEYRTVAMIYTSGGAANIQKIMESYTTRFEGSELAAAVPVGDILAYARSYVSLPATIRYSGKAAKASIFGTYPTVQTYTVSAPRGKYPYSVNSLTDEEKNSLLAQELESTQSAASSGLPGGSTTGTIDQAGDSKAGYTGEVFQVPEIVYTKEAPKGIILEFTPPYLSDDRVIASGGKYSVVRSDAVTKAKALADRQNKLRFGKRNGQSVVFPVEYTPTRPYSPVYLEFLGVVGQYRTDSTNIVFDNTGILVSTDAIFVGGVGQ